MANSMVVSAAFDPCLHQDILGGQHHQDHMIDVGTEQDSCHHEENSNAPHCQDACFCSMYLANHTPIFENQITQQEPHDTMISIVQDVVIDSGYHSPLYRPPINIS